MHPVRNRLLVFQFLSRCWHRFPARKHMAREPVCLGAATLLTALITLLWLVQVNHRETDLRDDGQDTY